MTREIWHPSSIVLTTLQALLHANAKKVTKAILAAVEESDCIGYLSWNPLFTKRALPHFTFVWHHPSCYDTLLSSISVLLYIYIYIYISNIASFCNSPNLASRHLAGLWTCLGILQDKTCGSVMGKGGEKQYIYQPYPWLPWPWTPSGSLSWWTGRFSDLLVFPD